MNSCHINMQAAHQIIAQCKLDASYHMLAQLRKQRDNFYPEGGSSPAATQLLNAEIAKVREHIVKLEKKGYDRWAERCEDWRSDYDPAG
jgi:hypothetical protein